MLPLSNTAIHLTRHQRITELSKGLSPSTLCGQVMASVRKIGKSKRQYRVGYPSGMATVFGDEPLYSRLPGGRLA